MANRISPYLQLAKISAAVKAQYWPADNTSKPKSLVHRGQRLQDKLGCDWKDTVEMKMYLIATAHLQVPHYLTFSSRMTVWNCVSGLHRANLAHVRVLLDQRNMCYVI